jgi:hypothetical protein
MDYIEDIERLIKKIGILLEEIEIYETRVQKIKMFTLNEFQIGYPCGLRKRIVRHHSYED